jgi:chorismate dehydratase
MADMSTELRIGLVRYLNAKPLYDGLNQLLPEAAFITDLPSRLAMRLQAGDLDVALIPSVEFLRSGQKLGYIAMPSVSIAAAGPVRSVKLLSHVDFPQIRRLAMDEGSRTSQALCRVWLHGVHGVLPREIEELPIGVPPEESTADAVLVIGDRAMRLPEAEFRHVVDMGKAWNQWTGLPFVFAVWAVRPQGVSDLDELSLKLIQCRDMGLKNVSNIAAANAGLYNLSVDEIVYYLTQQLSYDFGEAEIAGLRLFAAKASQMGLVPEGCDIVLHRTRDTAKSR